MAFVKYALVYEKEGKFYGSISGIPNTAEDTDLKITREQLKSYKLVYATKTEIKGSVTGIPAEDDDIIYSASTDEPAVVAEEDENPIVEETEEIEEE